VLTAQQLREITPFGEGAGDADADPFGDDPPGPVRS